MENIPPFFVNIAVYIKDVALARGQLYSRDYIEITI